MRLKTKNRGAIERQNIKIMDKISHLIKDYGLENTINIHEERISYAKTHPRNMFFINVIKESENQLKILKK